MNVDRPDSNSAPRREAMRTPTGRKFFFPRMPRRRLSQNASSSASRLWRLCGWRDGRSFRLAVECLSFRLVRRGARTCVALFAQRAAAQAGVLQIASVLGVITGGILADRLAKKHRGGRMMAQAVGLFAGVPFI